MDIDYLLARQQISILNAAAAKSSTARRVHEELAAAYALEIAKLHSRPTTPHPVPGHIGRLARAIKSTFAAAKAGTNP